MLHHKLIDIGFLQSITDKCIFKWTHDHFFIVGIYVDDLLITETDQSYVHIFEDFAVGQGPKTWS